MALYTGNAYSAEREMSASAYIRSVPGFFFNYSVFYIHIPVA